MTRTMMPTRPRAGATFLGILAALFLLFSLAPARAAETDDVLAKARALVDAKRYDEAAALVDPVISEDPKNGSALAIRAEARRLADRPDEARADYARIAALKPADADAWFWLGTLDRWHSRDKDAIYEYGRVLEVSPCHLDALKGRARSKRSVGNSRGAEADLREALRCGPKDEEAAGLLADLLADHGDLEGAQKVAAEEFSGPEVEKRLGDAALAAGQPGSAAAHYRKALEAGETAETLRALGEAERQRGDDMAALDAHRRASRLDREGTGDLYWIGVLASRLGYRDEAKQAWDAILAKHPADSGARVGKARILRSEGDRAGALKLVEDTLRDDPENGEALVLRGQLYSSMGRTEAARKDYRAELERHPDDGDARILLDRLPYRRAWGIGGNYDRARVVEGLEDRGKPFYNPAKVEYLNAGGSGELRWTLSDRMALVTEVSLRREAVFGLGPPDGPEGRSTIYDFDVLGGKAGLDQTLSDLWSLSWRVGARGYNPRSATSISSETHAEGEARLSRDDGRTRLDFLAARDSFIWRGYGANTQFRIFDRDRLRAGWERSLNRGFTANASTEVAHFDDGNTPFYFSAGVDWEQGRYGASLDYRHDPFPARFLTDPETNPPGNELDFIAYDVLSLRGGVALPLGFKLSGEALAGRYGATKREVDGVSQEEWPVENNTQRLFRGTLAWTPRSFRPLSLGAEYFWDNYAFFTQPYNTNNTHSVTLFAEVAGDAGDRWHYVARYDHGTIGDRRSPHYTGNSYFARVEARLGDLTREAGPIRLGLEARYRENGLDEDWNHCLAFLTVPF